jgi:biopolymer transport protein ExbD
LRDQDAVFFETHFDIMADRRASVQTVISLLEMLRIHGASRVTLGTERSAER